MSNITKLQKIDINGKVYDFVVPKSWTQTDPTAVDYVENRTHFAKPKSLGSTSTHITIPSNIGSFSNYPLPVAWLLKENDYLLVETHEDNSTSTTAATEKHGVSKLIRLGSADSALIFNYTTTRKAKIQVARIGSTSTWQVSFTVEAGEKPGDYSTEEKLKYPIKITTVEIEPLSPAYLPIDTGAFEITSDNKISVAKQSEFRYAGHLYYEGPNSTFGAHLNNNTEIFRTFLKELKRLHTNAVITEASFSTDANKEPTIQFIYKEDKWGIRAVVSFKATLSESEKDDLAWIVEQIKNPTNTLCPSNCIDVNHLTMTIDTTDYRQAHALDGICFVAGDDSAHGYVSDDNIQDGFELQPKDLILILNGEANRIRSTSNLPLTVGGAATSVRGGALDTTDVVATGANSFAFGSTVAATGANSFAFGSESEASHDFSAVLGQSLQTTRDHQVVVGQYNALATTGVTAEADPIRTAQFIVGGGSKSSRGNLLVVSNQGTLVNSPLQVGGNCTIGGQTIFGGELTASDVAVKFVDGKAVKLCGDTTIGRTSKDSLVINATPTLESGLIVEGETTLNGKTTITDTEDVVIDTGLQVTKSISANTVKTDNLSAVTPNGVLLMGSRAQYVSALGEFSASADDKSLPPKKYIDDHITAVNDRVTELSDTIGNLSNIMNFRGVFATKNACTDPKPGDVIVAQDTGYEYVYVGKDWAEIGDSSANLARITAIETSLADGGTAYEYIESAHTKIDNHTTDKANPHGVTKEQVDLGNVDNRSVAEIKADFTGGIEKDDDKFVLGKDVYSAIQTIKGTAFNKNMTELESAQTDHADDKANPHGVKASQLYASGTVIDDIGSIAADNKGLVQGGAVYTAVKDVLGTSSDASTKTTVYGVKAALTAHTNATNPHGITADSLGVGAFKDKSIATNISANNTGLATSGSVYIAESALKAELRGENCPDNVTLASLSEIIQALENRISELEARATVPSPTAEGQTLVAVKEDDQLTWQVLDPTTT